MEYDYIECGDCLELMKSIPDKSIDLIITDPPYGKKPIKVQTALVVVKTDGIKVVGIIADLIKRFLKRCSELEKT